MCWVLANHKTGEVFDFTHFSTAKKALEYMDLHYPHFKGILRPYNLEQRRFAEIRDL